MSVRLAASSAESMPLRARLGHQLANGREADVDGGRRQTVHRGPVLHEQRPSERPAGGEDEEQIEGLAVVAPGVGEVTESSTICRSSS